MFQKQSLARAAAALAFASMVAASPAAPQMLYVADPALNMIYGQALDNDTTNTLVPISGSVTIVADSVAHLSTREIAFVPNGEKRVVLLNLETREMKTIATSTGFLRVGAGLGENDFLWTEYVLSPQSRLLKHARRSAQGEWTVSEYTLSFESNFNFTVTDFFAVAEDRYAMVTQAGDLWLYRGATGEATKLNTLASSAIARGPANEILQYAPERTTTPAVFDSEGNALAAAAVKSAPIFARSPHVVQWRATTPQVAAVTRRLGEMLEEDTLDTTATVATTHTTRDENGSVIPERDITGAATLLRTTPERWQFFNETGGLQVLDTSTHRVEYQLQYSAGSGPEFSAIDAVAVGSDDKLYVLDAGQRLFRVTTGTGARELLKMLDTTRLLPFIDVRPDGTIVLVKHYVDAGATKWRLVTVTSQGGEWVAEEGTASDAPLEALILSIKPTAEGARALWREPYGTHLSDITATGAVALDIGGPVTSGAAAVEGTLLRFAVDVAPEDSALVGTVRLRWNYATTSDSLVPKTMRLVTPSGQIASFGWTDMQRYRPAPYTYYQTDVLVRLPQRELSSGRWTFEVETAGIGTPQTVAANFLTPVTMNFDPLDRTAMVAPSADGLRLLTRFPAAVLDTDDNVATGELRSLGTDAVLSRLSDTMTDGHGHLYLGTYDRFALWRVDETTGLAEPLVDKRPEGLDAAALGRNGKSFLQLAVGKVPEFHLAAGWIIN